MNCSDYLKIGTMTDIILKPGREKSILRRHPWIFSGSVAQVRGNVERGGIVNVFSSKKEFLGRGSFHPDSSIRIRIWTFEDEPVNEELISKKLRIATTLRKDDLSLFPKTCCRLFYAESDGIPGLIVDSYGKYLVVQFLTSGVELWKKEITAILSEITGIENIYERSDVDVRELEGMQQSKGVLTGKEPPDVIRITENGLNFFIDIVNGQKTGFYIDQRENRMNIRKYTKGKSVLNCFSYTGGFSMNAWKGGADQILSIEASEDAVSIAKKNTFLNGIDMNKIKWIVGDVFEELRNLRNRAQKFDLIILDPPKFAPTVSQVQAASRGYKDINLLAFKLLNPRGVLVTFSCSGGVSRELFQKIVAGAALDAGVEASVLEFLSQAPDHPIALNFPEAEYLKGLVCRII